jgi:molybdopterin synthase sulfur carrier subunit
MMNVNVLLFASYADALGTSAMQVDVPERASVGEVIAVLRSGVGGDRLPATPLVAVNQSYATLADVIHPGDELAVIPPVAGG